MNTDKKYFLSWQNEMLGPHSVEEIKTLLSDRKIHSLFKVQSGEKEILIREFLAGLNDEKKKASSGPPLRPTLVPEATPEYGNSHSGSAGSPPPPPPPPHDPWDESLQGPPPPPPPYIDAEPKFAYAVTSLVLSLLFIIPFLNLIAWVMSLIFGHLFLHSVHGDRTQRGYTHAWCGVWLTYIFGGFYLIMCFTFAIEGTQSRLDLFDDWLPVVHGLMLGGALGSCVVSGLLIGGTKMVTGAMPKIGIAFVAGTLGVMIGLILQFMIGLMTSDTITTENTALLVIFSVGVVVFLIQALAWSEMIKVRDEEKLGFGRAIVVSLFCSICQLFIAFALITFTKIFA